MSRQPRLILSQSLRSNIERRLAVCPNSSTSLFTLQVGMSVDTATGAANGTAVLVHFWYKYNVC